MDGSKYTMDLHTHTIVSGHAYNTMNEMIRAAADKNLKIIGITEHAPAMPGSTNLYYFQNLNILRNEKYGVHVLYGAELNILDEQGTTDLDARSWRDLDYCIASFHDACTVSGTKEENTNAYVQAMKHPKVMVLGHPDNGIFPADYEELVRAAAEEHVLIELNNNSLNPQGFRLNARNNDLVILDLCVKHHVPVLLSSDAHCEEEVGNFSRVIPLLQETGFPEELVVNQSEELLRQYLPTA